MVGKHEEIVRMLREGKTVREICRELRVSSKTVCRVRKELGLAGRRVDEAREEELRRRLGELEAELERRERELAGLRRKSKVLGALCFVEALFVLMLALLL